YNINQIVLFAIDIALALHEIHSINLIHGEISSNIIIESNKSTNYKLLYFANLPLSDLKSDLPYMAPELLSHSYSDSRADLYSLGVLLYKMSTGILPCSADETIEMVHQQLAQKPDPPSSINRSILEPLSEIISKLLEKNPDKRYQTAYGVKQDLILLNQNLTTPGIKNSFHLAQSDIVPKLKFTDKLYGRDTEKQLLRDKIALLQNGKFKIIKISGKAGVGKTSLVNEIIPDIQNSGRIFISGKCSQIDQQIPYQVISELFQDFIHQFLKKPDDKISEFRNSINRGFIKSAKILTKIIPDLELLTGPLQTVEIPDPVESKNRLQVSFMEFVKIISTKNAPLVIFIDDLQWIDNSSIDLLQSALFNMSDNNHLMIIFAYRQIELAINRNITHFLDSVQNITDLAIDLSPLKKGSIANLLSDTLSCSNEDSYRLSDLILTKTRGNPFYTKVFLENLYNEKILTFHYSSQTWQWDTISIQTRPGMENVVDLLISGLKKLDNRYIDILSYAACLGEQFDPSTLSIILDIPDSKIEIILDEIADRGYISKYNKKDLYYHFIHDRIQQAAYSLLSETQQISAHLNIARKLNRQAENNENQILSIVIHYNRGASKIDSISEIMELIKLNIQAGQITRDQSAWDTYFSYSSSGIVLAKKIKHKGKYATLLQLYKQGIESAKLVGNDLQMESWIKESEIFVHTTADQILLKKERITTLLAKYRMFEAYKEADELLNLLAVKVSKINKILYLRLLRKTEKYFTQLPEMKDPQAILAAGIQMLSFAAAYLTMPNELPKIIIRMMDLSLLYGKSNYYPFILVMFGAIHINKPNQIKHAARFGRLGMKHCSGEKYIPLQSKVYMIYGGFIQHWVEPIGNSIETIKEGQEIGLEHGDFEYAVLSQNVLQLLDFASGKNLQVMEYEKKEQIESKKNLGFNSTLSSAIRTSSIIKNLSDKTDSKFSLSDKEMDEKETLKNCKLAKDNSGIASLYTFKLMIHYYYDDFETALIYSEKAGKYAIGLLGQFTYIWLIWFSALSHIKLLHKSATKDRLQIIQDKYKLLAGFAKHAPANHSHRVFLIKAELARYRKKNSIAIRNYEKAIYAAKENGFIQDEALTSECAGEFYFDRGKEIEAKAYISHAYDCYHKWGAIRKLEHLKEKYPFLSDISKITTSPKNIAEQVSRIVDVSSIISASQAISKEIVLRDLIDTVLKIVIQNSGAQKGLLFFADDREELSLKATVYFDNQDYRIELNPSSAVDKERIYSQILLVYTVRSKKTHIIHNAETSAEYSNSTYIQENKIKSVLCLPLLHMGKLTGCIYLENNLSPGIFSTERLEVLKLLAGQIAISLENSRLYESLQQSYSVLQKKEQQNQEQFRQLIQAEKLASLGILAASITHEVSNPNYAIQLNSEFLASSKTDILTLLDEYSSDLKDVQINGLSFNEFRDKFPKVIDTILNCSRQIDGVIKELKNYARREPEKPMTELQINPLIESTVMMCTGFIEKATSNFSIHLGDNIPTVPGHYQKLQQVLMNLIINACQALQEKSSTLHIESAYNKADHQVQIKIIDQGTGIITDHFEQISKPFFSTKGSMGLGLSISQEIIKLHNGTLKFIPNDNAGTTVVISLPIIEKEILIL
ncbi:MAG: AAA family ATPase, partial [Spirochaetaceae bacterium]|nr:AAA family ATPase [Spirochaetaceae bacterium]